jgi:hypothetical protein
MLFEELSSNEEELTIFNCLSYYNENITLSTNKLNLHLPSDRYNNITYTIKSIEPNLQTILKVVYYFYNMKSLKLSDLELIENEKDVFDYIKAAKQKIINNEKVFRSDIMGDLIFIEDIQIKDNDIYIHMGS